MNGKTEFNEYEQSKGNGRQRKDLGEVGRKRYFRCGK